MRNWILLMVGFVMVYHGSFSIQRVRHQSGSLSTLSIRFPNVVLAQGLVETGMFSSKIYKENNNWLGMKCATQRKTTCIGTHRGHALYKSTEDCTYDYYLWQSKYLPKYEEKVGPVITEDQYLEFLKAYNYAEDPEYIFKVKSKLKFVNKWTKS